MREPKAAVAARWGGRGSKRKRERERERPREKTGDSEQHAAYKRRAGRQGETNHHHDAAARRRRRKHHSTASTSSTITSIATIRKHSLLQQLPRVVNSDVVHGAVEVVGRVELDEVPRHRHARAREVADRLRDHLDLARQQQLHDALPLKKHEGE